MISKKHIKDSISRADKSHESCNGVNDKHDLRHGIIPVIDGRVGTKHESSDFDDTDNPESSDF